MATVGPAARIAIVGLACRYADAHTPAALWDNVLARRRAFRRIPPERLSADYWSADPDAADLTYATHAAVLEGYRFDRVRYRIGASTVRSADLAHWLALDVASDAFRDGGFDGGASLPRASTAVVVGNTLTGEFSRAAGLRLRWPYVRRVVDAALERAGESPARRSTLLQDIERAFKEPFPQVDGETLAGGLSNTIAGRIANYFDLKGGGYTVDGACASSLLAVSRACDGLSLGDCDVALAGGVDLSLDPFELVGFAKAGALARDDMRVFDARPTGFWPGEGCGLLVLMREEDARREGRRIYALICGWGISSDGAGGMTRPEQDGQILALERAYARAGFGIDTVGYFEGHGTGTAVGDATELGALIAARNGRHVDTLATIGTIKANIGHTKAAAGAAGLMKAAIAVDRGILPPTTGCRDPHPVLARSSSLRILEQPEPWPERTPRRAGVSSMGFGGINVHVAIEAPDAATQPRSHVSRRLVRSWQDAELFAFSADDGAGLRAALERALARAAGLSLAELTDAAATTQQTASDGPIRAAVIAATAEQLESRLRLALDAVAAGNACLDIAGGVFVGHGSRRPRVALLFTGQGAPVRLNGGRWAARFDEVSDLYESAALPAAARDGDTEVAQPAIVAASLAGHRVLQRLGIGADIAVGHSLGELTALRWAGALSDHGALQLARTRGQLMSALAAGPGAMAAIAAPERLIEELIDRTPVVIAGFNSDGQIVVSGARDAVHAVEESARVRGLHVTPLRVAHGFHSPLMEPVRNAFADTLARVEFQPLDRAIASTTTGALLARDCDLRALLSHQLVNPVRFVQALQSAGEIALFIEVGPGNTLATLAGATVGAPCVSLDVGGPSFQGLLAAVGVAFAMGAGPDLRALAEGRFARNFDWDRKPEFLVNPCELTPAGAAPAPVLKDSSTTTATVPTPAAPRAHGQATACEILRELVASRTELPIDDVAARSRFLSDLHMTSIAVGELLGDAARRLQIEPLIAPLDFADATIEDAAAALERVSATAADPSTSPIVAGVDTWVRAFAIRDVDSAPPGAHGPLSTGSWRVFATPDHPLAAGVAGALADGAAGPGIIACIDDDVSAAAGVLLESSRAALASPGAKFLVVQTKELGGGFAKALSAEAPQLHVGVLTVDRTDPDAAARIRDEAVALDGFTQVRWDSGRRLMQVAHLLPVPAETSPIPLGPTDVLLVTGGGKGIGAECALALAQRSAARLAILGRSDPKCDDVLASNLDRIRRAGIVLQYVQADVTSESDVRRAVGDIERHTGPVTAVLHAAGVNQPTLISALDEQRIRATLAPKLDGARHLASCLSRERLRFFVSFGSIIARTAVPGEAHYAMANEALRGFTTEMALAGFPAFTIEWSVWAAAGMGERLGRLDELARRGVTAIDIPRGVAMLASLIATASPGDAVVVAGRFGDAPTLPRARTTLPLARFLERPRVDYRSIELVADAELSVHTDPYLADHRLDGRMLFPGVMGLEAMVQAATALLGDEPLALEQVEFLRAIPVPDDATLTIRVAALVTGPGEVTVAIRTSDTAFQVDHFRGICRCRPTTAEPRLREIRDGVPPPLPLDPPRDLYGTVLFHSGRFARLTKYSRLLATECDAEIGAAEASWFGPFLPAALWLGDPGARDAALHAVQACIPQRRLVPVRVGAIHRISRLTGPCRVRAWQRDEDGADYEWDLDIVGLDGAPLEIWRGLRLRAIAPIRVEAPRVSLLGPFVERSLPILGHRAPARVVVVQQPEGPRTDDVAELLTDRPEPVLRRPDGRPELGGRGISFAHAGVLTLGVAADAAAGCDVEPVTTRAWEVWRDLLGADRSELAALIARERPEEPTAGATRVWAAMESLKKAGASPAIPLLLGRVQQDGWVTLRAGAFDISTWVGEVPGAEPMAIAIATGEPYARV